MDQGTEMETRCRLCAEFAITQLSVLDDVDLNRKIFQMFNVKIDETDRLPRIICQQCYDKIETHWQFGKQIQKAQEFLTELLNSVLRITNEMPVTYVEQSVQVELPELSEETEVEHKVEKTQKQKVKKPSKKRHKLTDIDGMDNIEYETNPDGSITLTSDHNSGWDSYRWSCCECQSFFPSSDDLREHYTTTHNTVPRFVCIDCSKVYTKYTTFIAHVKTHRSALDYCCDVCGKWYYTVEELEKHRTGHEDTKPHTCTTCGKRFRMQSALIVHARSHLPAELKNRYQCDQCSKRFGTKPNLMAHKRIHSGIREFTCDQCGKSFVHKGNLDTHLLTHTIARPFTCTVCNKSFKTLIRLKKHSSVHSGLKPHQCDICGRQFRERGTLKEHHRIHTGAMPFTCEFCGKCFRFKGVLTTHRRQHTGERPYSCNECQHHFTNWPNYNKHMKRRHGINTSVNCRTRQDIPPTGMPQRNPPGTVLAPPQPVAVIENFAETSPSFYPVLSLYNLPDDLLQQRV